jgi:hypothetical protein
MLEILIRIVDVALVAISIYAIVTIVKSKKEK